MDKGHCIITKEGGSNSDLRAKTKGRLVVALASGKGEAEGESKRLVGSIEVGERRNEGL